MLNSDDERSTGSTVDSDKKTNLLRLTAEIAASYVVKNAVTSSDLPPLILKIHHTLSDLGSDQRQSTGGDQKPAVPIRKSVHPDYIICLEDGRKLQILKRHLRTQYNMTTDEYKAKWNLPSDYPMVAPNYSKKRSTFARSIGLGTKEAMPGKRGY